MRKLSKPHAHFGAVGALCLALGACSPQPETERIVIEPPGYSERLTEEIERVPTETSSARFVLDDERLAAETRKALDGDGEAAIALAEHYSVISPDDSNIDDVIHWLEIGVEGGNVRAMSMLANALSLRRGPGDCERAVRLVRRWREEGRPSQSELASSGVSFLEMDIARDCGGRP